MAHTKEEVQADTVVIEAAEAKWEPNLRFIAAFGSLLVVILAAALDATSLSVALPIISRNLNGTGIEAYWSGTSFLLSSTVFQLTFGSLSQAFGRKYLVIIALVFFTVGSIVAATANSLTVLLIGRTIQGCGGGGIISVTEIIVTDLVPLRERGTWFAYVSAVWALGTVTGPVIGGAFAQRASWRWIFWINLPICGAGFVTTIAFLNLNRVPGSLVHKFARFDWTGVAILTASITSFLIAVSWGNVMFPWSSWRTIVPLVLGVIGMTGFVAFEATIPADPVIRLAVFKHRTALVSYIGTFVHGLVLWSLLYYLPLYYQCVKGYSAIISGVAAFPETFTVAPASIVVGILVSKWGSFRWAIWMGWFLTVLGMGLLCLLNVATTIPQWLFLNLVPGIGLGMLFSSLAYSTQAAAEEKDVAYAASMYTFSRSFGQSVGVAIGGAVFQSQFELKLRAYPTLAGQAVELAQDAVGLIEIVKAMPSNSPERLMIITAYSNSLRVVWAVMAGLAFVALCLSLLTGRHSVDRKHESDQKLKH